MKAKLSLTFRGVLALALLPCFLAAQNTVSPPHRRQDTLDKIEGVLAYEAVQWPRAEIARLSPFRPADAGLANVGTNTEQVVTTDPRPGRTEPPPPVGPQRLSDTDAVATIARSVRPTGSMVSPRGHVLLLPGGNWREGVTRPVDIGDIRYEVTLEEVTEDGYILRVGEARLLRRFMGSGLSTSSTLRATNAGD